DHASKVRNENARVRRSFIVSSLSFDLYVLIYIYICICWSIEREFGMRCFHSATPPRLPGEASCHENSGRRIILCFLFFRSICYADSRLIFVWRKEGCRSCKILHCGGGLKAKIGSVRGLEEKGEPPASTRFIWVRECLPASDEAIELRRSYSSSVKASCLCGSESIFISGKF